MSSSAANPSRHVATLQVVAALALAAVALVLVAERGGRAPKPPTDRPGILGHVIQTTFAAAHVAKPDVQGRPASGARFAHPAPEMLHSPWDVAIAAVLAAEDDHASTAHDLAFGDRAPTGEPGAHFRAAFAQAYERSGGQMGDLPPDVRSGLGDGLAARLLAARLGAPRGELGGTLVQALLVPERHRLRNLGVLTVMACVVAFLGVVLAIWLWTTRRRRASPRPPRWAMAGPSLSLALAAWFVTLLLAGPSASALVARAPAWAPYRLTVAFLVQAVPGLALLCWAERATPAQLWRRAAPGSAWRALGSGLGWLPVLVATAFAIGRLTAVVEHLKEPAQARLMDTILSVHGTIPIVVLLATAAVLVPLCEELVFRGVLQPWLTARTGAPFALVMTSLLFGMAHRLPAGLPVLAAMGLVLGLTARRSGSIVASALVHGAWNALMTAGLLLMR